LHFHGGTEIEKLSLAERQRCNPASLSLIVRLRLAIRLGIEVRLPLVRFLVVSLLFSLGSCGSPKSPATQPPIACANLPLTEVDALSQLPEGVRALTSKLSHGGLLDRGARLPSEVDCVLLLAGQNPMCAIVAIECGGYVPTFTMIDYQHGPGGWQELIRKPAGDPQTWQGFIEMAKFVFSDKN
jgi:hypothetical protein